MTAVRASPWGGYGAFRSFAMKAAYVTGISPRQEGLDGEGVPTDLALGRPWRREGKRSS